MISINVETSGRLKSPIVIVYVAKERLVHVYTRNSADKMCRKT